MNCLNNIILTLRVAFERVNASTETEIKLKFPQHHDGILSLYYRVTVQPLPKKRFLSEVGSWQGGRERRGESESEERKGKCQPASFLFRLLLLLLRLRMKFLLLLLLRPSIPQTQCCRWSSFKTFLFPPPAPPLAPAKPPASYTHRWQAIRVKFKRNSFSPILQAMLYSEGGEGMKKGVVRK